MSQAETGVPVRILGEDYRLAGASPERVRALAAFVDQKYREALAARPTMDSKRLSVVVCLTLAEELFEERARGRSRQAFEADALRRLRRCRDRLDAAVLEAAGGENTGPNGPN
jgi:cell division protein ZapA (FtsZ GTPase activity inhibitor)